MMPAPLLPLLSGLVQAAGSTLALGARAGTSHAAMFAGGLARRAQSMPSFAEMSERMAHLRPAMFAAGLAQRRPPMPTSADINVDVSALARKLGTSNPSRDQIESERERIFERRKKKHRDKYGPEKNLGQSMRDVSKAMPLLALKTAAAAAAMGAAGVGAAKLAGATNNADVEKLRWFNAGIGRLAAQKEVFAIQHARREGKAVEGSTVRLGKAMMQMQRQFQPFTSLGTNATNFAKEFFLNSATGWGMIAEEIGLRDLIKKANEKWFDPGGDPDPAVRGLIDELRSGRELGGIKNRRPDELPGTRMR